MSSGGQSPPELDAIFFPPDSWRSPGSRQPLTMASR